MLAEDSNPKKFYFRAMSGNS
jgi:hypothetical protein